MGKASIALAALVFASGCKMTPEEITRIQVENELLREEVRIIRSNCSYYRELEVEAEDGAQSDE